MLKVETFGTAAYRRLVKSKSIIVKQILDHGYGVFFVDLDIILFKNPLETVTPDPQVMHIQSDVKSEWFTALRFVQVGNNSWISTGANIARRR